MSDNYFQYRLGTRPDIIIPIENRVYAQVRELVSLALAGDIGALEEKAKDLGIGKLDRLFEIASQDADPERVILLIDCFYARMARNRNPDGVQSNFIEGTFSDLLTKVYPRTKE